MRTPCLQQPLTWSPGSCPLPTAWPRVTVLCVIHYSGAPAACIVENNAFDFNQSCCQALSRFFCASLSSKEKNFLRLSFYTNLPDTLRFCRIAELKLLGWFLLNPEPVATHLLASGSPYMQPGVGNGLQGT